MTTKREGVLFSMKNGKVPKQGEIQLVDRKTPSDSKKEKNQKGGQSSMSSISLKKKKAQEQQDKQDKEHLYTLHIQEETKTEVAKVKERTEQEFAELLDHAGGTLYKTSTIFPFDFFPNDIVIDRYKVNIINREFFASEQILSIPIKDIKSVMVETAPLFATLRIVTDAFSQNQTKVDYLKRNDAERARRIISGLIVSARQKIDVALLPPNKVAEKLEKLGAITT